MEKGSEEIAQNVPERDKEIRYIKNKLKENKKKKRAKLCLIRVPEEENRKRKQYSNSAIRAQTWPCQLLSQHGQKI